MESNHEVTVWSSHQTLLEVETGFEPACAALQAATWPLGHSTHDAYEVM